MQSTCLSLRSLTRHPNTFVDASEVVRVVQDFVVQYCVMKSLPFSAAQMTLNCVSVVIVTIFPEEADTKVINQLSVSKNKSHRQVSTMMREINHLRSHVDIGGGDSQKGKVVVKSRQIAQNDHGFDYIVRRFLSGSANLVTTS